MNETIYKAVNVVVKPSPIKGIMDFSGEVFVSTSEKLVQARSVKVSFPDCPTEICEAIIDLPEQNREWPDGFGFKAKVFGHFKAPASPRRKRK